MPRPEDNVVPFRPRPRRWTRPEDFGHDQGRPPKKPKPPRRPPGRLAAWALIAALVLLTVAWSVWG